MVAILGAEMVAHIERGMSLRSFKDAECVHLMMVGAWEVGERKGFRVFPDFRLEDSGGR